MSLEPAWTLDRFRAADLGRTRAWILPRLADRVHSELGLFPAAIDEPLGDDVDTLVVVGGGSLIDRAKVAAKDRPRPLRLVAVPSIWGSGAEASPIVVLDHGGVKEIRIDARYRPDHRVFWPELADSVSSERARWACGDCWAHALEGFLSPLADATLRAELAALMGEMLRLPLDADPRWFELSAQACAGQARSSVGLMHGIAHTIEGPLGAAEPGGGWGHARIIATVFLAVLRFNRRTSTKCNELAAGHGLDLSAVERKGAALVDRGDCERLRPVIAACWPQIVRDRCTRTNCALVRPGSVESFLSNLSEAS